MCKRREHNIFGPYHLLSKRSDIIGVLGRGGPLEGALRDYVTYFQHYVTFCHVVNMLDEALTLTQRSRNIHQSRGA